MAFYRFLFSCAPCYPAFRLYIVPASGNAARLVYLRRKSSCFPSNKMNIVIVLCPAIVLVDILAFCTPGRPYNECKVYPRQKELGAAKRILNKRVCTRLGTMGPGISDLYRCAHNSSQFWVNPVNVSRAHHHLPIYQAQQPPTRLKSRTQREFHLQMRHRTRIDTVS